MTQTGILLTTLACMLAGQVGYFVGYVFDPTKPIMRTYCFMVSLNAFSRQEMTLRERLLDAE